MDGSGRVLPTVVTRSCSIGEMDELPESVSKCLVKGAVEYAYQVLLSLSDVSLLPPNDEPPGSLCIIDGSVVEGDEELRAEFGKLGIPVGRVVISPRPQGSGEEAGTRPGRTVPSSFIIVATGRSTGDVYAFSVYYLGEWCVVPLPPRLVSAVSSRFMDKCSAGFPVHEEVSVVTVSIPIEGGVDEQ